MDLLRVIYQGINTIVNNLIDQDENAHSVSKRFHRIQTGGDISVETHNHDTGT